MRKVPFISVFWFFALALPATVLALAGVAYLDLHLSQVAAAIAQLELVTTTGGRGWAAETAARLPELAGMVVGMAVIYTIYIFVRKPAQIEYTATPK